jgi:hypothetical protein
MRARAGVFFIQLIDMHIGSPIALNQQGKEKAAITEPPMRLIPGRATPMLHARPTYEIPYLKPLPLNHVKTGLGAYPAAVSR